MTRELTLESGSRDIAQGQCARHKQGRTRKNMLPSSFIRSGTESRFALNAWLIEGIGNQSRWCYVLLLLEGWWLDALIEKWKRSPAHTRCGRGGSRVSGKERRVKFGREKKEWET